MSTLAAKNGQKTAEEIADMKTLAQAKAKPKVESSHSSDSDEGLPPPIPQSKPMGFKLAIGGLGLSTIAKEGQKTAEEIADMQTLAQSKLKP